MLPDSSDSSFKSPSVPNFEQQPPQINQFARLNAEFVEPNTSSDGTLIGDGPFWRPVDAWTNPIWGWIVTDYKNHGIHIFRGDGTFFRDLRVNGEGVLKITKGLSSSAAGQPETTQWSWLEVHPEKEKEAANANAQQLALLVNQLQNGDFLKDFMGMNTKATDAKDPHFEFFKPLVGRPLALVNMSWSLELTSAVSPFNNGIANEDMPDRNGASSLNLKVGSQEDGLIGFSEARVSPELGNALKLDQMFTSFVPKDRPATPRLVTSSVENYPVLDGFFVDPLGMTPKEYEKRRNEEIGKHVFGALVDPFSAVRGYTSMLPIKELGLIEWMWKDPFEKIVVFLKAGPLVVTGKDGHERVKETGSDIGLGMIIT